MNLRSPTLRVSFGLTLLTVSLLLLADLMGFVPNQRKAVLDARRALCESLAVHFSTAIANSSYDTLQQTMNAIVRRNEGIQSMRICTHTGRVVSQAGDHEPWVDLVGAKSVPGQVVVPILKGGDRWGDVEIRFADMTAESFLGLPMGQLLELILFIAIVGFLLYSVFIKKVLRQLDPSSVIPARVKTTLDVLAEGVVLMDKNERIVLANSTFSKLTQRDDKTLLGQRASELNWISPSAESASTRLPWVRAMAEGVQQTGVILPLRERSGVVRQLAVNGAPILDAKGGLRGALATFDDVTEIEEKNEQLRQMVELLEAARDEVSRKNDELRATNQIIEAKVAERTEDLRQSMEAAQAADRAKSEFLANISHELRTPMHAILSFARFGEKKIDKASKEKLLGYFENIRTSGDSLLNLLNDLLDLSKFQAEKMRYTVESTPLAELLGRVMTESEGLAGTSGVQLQLGELPDELTADLDPARITQVLRNLLSNAVKFSERGGMVSVTVAEATIDKARGELVPAVLFSVADEGVGIPEDELETIFDPFTQSRRTKSGSGGTGLGLAICKEIVTGHDGWIRASSRPEGGTLMQFAVPREHAFAEPIEAE